MRSGEPWHVAAVFSSRPSMGGAFQYSLCIWEALKALASAGRWRLSVLCLSAEWADLVRGDGFAAELLPETSVANACRRLLKKLPMGPDLWRAQGYRVSPHLRRIHELSPDVALFPCEAYLALGTSLPSVAPIHDLMYIYEGRFPEVGSRGRARRRRLVDEHLCRQAGGILVDSPTGKRHVLESLSVDEDRIHVLPYIAPPTVLGPPRDVGLTFSDFLYYPAQLWEHKNHVGLLRAMALLAEEGLRVNCVLTGGMENGGEETLAEVVRLGLQDQVAYLGYLDAPSVASLYRRARCLVMPSFFGPTNIPPLEAFTHGCPVAAAGVYGVPEQLGSAAVYFRPDDVEDIARVVGRLWRDEALRRELIGSGREWIGRWNQRGFNERLGQILTEVARCAGTLGT